MTTSLIKIFVVGIVEKEKGLIKYLIDQIEFLREEIKAKNKIIDHLFTLKLSLRASKFSLIKMFKLIKVINEVYNETVFHNCSP